MRANVTVTMGRACISACECTCLRSDTSVMAWSQSSFSLVMAATAAVLVALSASAASACCWAASTSPCLASLCTCPSR